MKKIYAEIRSTYSQKTVRARIEAFFLDNIGKIATREQIIEVAKDPKTGKVPENWHQRLSELRTDYGYSILTWRNRGKLKISEYLMPTAARRKRIRQRVVPTLEVWKKILVDHNNKCAWSEGSSICGLRDGDIDPIGGGTVRMTPDHKQPHSINATADPNNPKKWQPLCGRHQVVKKNFWDHETGKLNTVAIVQAAPESEKLIVYEFLNAYFADGHKDQQ